MTRAVNRKEYYRKLLITESTNNTSSTLYRHLYSFKVKGFPNHIILASSTLGKNKYALPVDTCIKPKQSGSLTPNVQ